MRPGPRLVVMALAFISGAQRGTTTTHNSANYYNYNNNNNKNNHNSNINSNNNNNNNRQQQQEISSKFVGGSGGSGSGGSGSHAQNEIVKFFDDQGPLARINPWLSACDLAQNRKSPDLQVSTNSIQFPSNK